MLKVDIRTFLGAKYPLPCLVPSSWTCLFTDPIFARDDVVSFGNAFLSYFALCFFNFPVSRARSEKLCDFYWLQLRISCKSGWIALDCEQSLFFFRFSESNARARKRPFTCLAFCSTDNRKKRDCS